MGVFFVQEIKWGVFVKKVDLTPTKWTKLNKTLLFYFTFYLFEGGGVPMHPTHPPCLRAWDSELNFWTDDFTPSFFVWIPNSVHTTEYETFFTFSFPHLLSVTNNYLFCSQWLWQLRYVGRPVSAIPATGIGEVHQQEARNIIEDLFTKSK